MKKRISIITLVAVLLILTACAGPGGSETREESSDDGKINIVATTTMLTDLIKQIGGDNVEVEGLMGPGIDPHGYKATARDNTKLFEADIAAYQGLELEGQMIEVFQALESYDKTVFALEEGVVSEDLIATGDIAYDPHIWFDVALWKDSANYITEELIAYDEENAEEYAENNRRYQEELDQLDDYIHKRIEEVDEEQRYLVTAHDAFAYFGRAYGFEVIGIQGLNTQTEAGTGDISQLAGLIAENEINAIFIESSVPTRNIESLQAAVEAKGHQVEIGGELFSDSLGDKSQDAETYTKMYKSNIDTIVDALR